jgi:hypothetical protein
VVPAIWIGRHVCLLSGGSNGGYGCEGSETVISVHKKSYYTVMAVMDKNQKHLFKIKLSLNSKLSVNS